MTPNKKRKTDPPVNNAPPPKSAALLGAPAAVRATITVLGNSPSPVPVRQRRPREPTPHEPEPEAEPEVPEAGPSSRSKPKRKKSSKRKTLTTKGKKAVVLNVLATVEKERAAAAAAAATIITATEPQAASSAAVPDEAKRNLGKAWSKVDLAKLARLAEDKDFLLQTIPNHPDPNTNNGDLDWELISSHFGRFSKGGVAVRHQYNAVVRMMKEAKGEGRKGSNYCDLVKAVLSELPENKGTVYEIQALLKKKHAKHLDKYKVNGQIRWKKAVGEVLRQETAVFEAVEKTESGKIVWKLK